MSEGVVEPAAAAGPQSGGFIVVLCRPGKVATNREAEAVRRVEYDVGVGVPAGGVEQRHRFFNKRVVTRPGGLESSNLSHGVGEIVCGEMAARSGPMNLSGNLERIVDF